MANARFQNLPRIEFTTLDGQLIALRDRPLTESVLIVGPAVDGPVDRIIPVNNSADIELLYGGVTWDTSYVGPSGEVKGYNGNVLVKALREAQLGGAADIRLLRVGGSYATGTFAMGAQANAGPSGTVTLRATMPGRIYNQTTLAFASGAATQTATLTQPTVKGGTLVFTLNTSASATLAVDFLDRINSHPLNRTLKATIGTLNTGALARQLNGTAVMVGGTDGTQKDDLSVSKSSYWHAMVDATSGLFNDFLADTEVDILHLAGIYLDDMVDTASNTTTIATDIASFLGKRTVDYPMLAVIGVRPLADYSDRTKIQTHYAALVNPTAATRDATTYLSQAGYFMYNGFTYNDGTLEQPIDSGAYLQVVAADVIINDPDLGLYTESAAALYAGSLAALKPHRAATYKPVQGIFGLPWEFNRTQLDALVGGVGQDRNQDVLGSGAYVTVRRLPDRGTLWVKDVTAANRKSDFKSLQPLRIANACHKGIREIAFPFLGENNDIPNRQSLETQLKTFLDTMAEVGALLGKEGVGYYLRVRGGDSPLSQLLGILDIDVTLRPALQIQAIKVKVRLSL